MSLTLVSTGGGGAILPLSENRDFSGTKPPLDLRPVCKFKFVCCGPGDKKQMAVANCEFRDRKIIKKYLLYHVIRC